MSFEPKNEAHSIVEAVFGITLRRPFNRSEIEALVGSHDRWRDHLPKISRQSTLQVIVAENGQPSQSVPAPAGGVVFDRFKPDGTPAWRLNVKDQTVLVNCLEYTRWSEIRPRAIQLIADASDVAVVGANPITGFMLQYIDIFEWKNRNISAKVGELLNISSPLIPEAIGSHGDLWHVHQGWFRTQGLPTSGRILERLNIDGVYTGDKIPAVKFDTMLRLDLAEPLRSSDVFRGESGNSLFDYLHIASKDLLGKVLSAQAKTRIGLDANA